MKKNIFSLTILTFLLLVLVGCSCKHEWNDATCLTPKTCAKCAQVEGEALGHTWVDATCASPKTCSICGTVEGGTLDHTWVAATCSAPKTCSICNSTTGKALAHIYGDWEIDVVATVSKSGLKTRYCTSCQKSDRESYNLESYVEDSKFIFTPEEFRDRFFDIFVDLGYSKFGGAQTREKDGQVIVDIRDIGYNNVGNVGFVADKNTWRMATSKTQNGFDGILMIISAPEEFVANAIIAVIMSTNPTISEYGARQVAKSVLEDETTYDGIAYYFAVTGDYYTMTAVPVE